MEPRELKAVEATHETRARLTCPSRPATTADQARASGPRTKSLSQESPCEPRVVREIHAGPYVHRHRGELRDREGDDPGAGKSRRDRGPRVPEPGARGAVRRAIEA